jgi:hypothetical protein
MTTRKPKITAKQEGGDDGYCYVVRVDGRVFMTGLTRSEVPYYKSQAMKRWEEKQADASDWPPGAPKYR